MSSQPEAGQAAALDLVQGHAGPAEDREEYEDQNVPMSPQDRSELLRLARTYTGRLESQTAPNGIAPVTSNSDADGTDIEKSTTLAGVGIGHPALDPANPAFDIYVWARFVMQAFTEIDNAPRNAGIIFKNLGVSGSGDALALQRTLADVALAPLRAAEYVSLGHKPHKRILHHFDGLVKSGELLIVLGRPGSGCSTLLKTLCGELHGLTVEPETDINYDGIPQAQMLKQFGGDVVYNGEVDKHFPHLTTGQTLTFASASRTPQTRPYEAKRSDFVDHMARVAAAICGLSHTWNTMVGNDFVRGVSGGERKRVSIAEMLLAGSPIAAWDNSTRGLDSASALEFVKTLRITANVVGLTHAVAIYQASQAIYDVFDKAVVLYEGREIFFGPTKRAEQYFVDMGWSKPARQTTGDFLTSVTNPVERKAREGFEDRVPKTAEDFETYWRNSSDHRDLMSSIAEHEAELNGDLADKFQANKVRNQAKHVRPSSSYVISPAMQVRIAIIRAYQRILGDKASTLTTVIGNICLSLIIGSIFYGSGDTTSSFFAKGSALFFAALINALTSISEITSLYSQRAIVEKQKSYRFIHPAAEAFAGIVSDLPIKFVLAIAFNVILYFLSGLRYEAGPFFIFFLFLFTATITLSGMFRTLAAITKTVSAAMACAGVLVLAIVIYTGFVIPTPTMHPWFGWIHWINPVYYLFEALVANEFHGRNFPCAATALVPATADLSSNNFICASVGAVAGQDFVSGDAYIAESYNYCEFWIDSTNLDFSHVWRNFGIMLAFLFFFEVIYIVASELNSSTSSQAEFLVFRRGHVPAYLQPEYKDPGEKEEDQQDEGLEAIPEQKNIFTWQDVSYVIPVKGGERKLLDNVSGWVKPGTLTALMGVSGAGKTTLLDVLSQRISFGVITGDMLVNGKPLAPDFQRQTGYCMQQDLHLETSTVREALRFAAVLRQPRTVPRAEKYAHVEEVIKMLRMEDFAEAVVGQPGEGLNVEQRKLLSIGVELAAKPAILLFLDEPTSGLDSQSSWAICAFLRKLADSGQAVLATIHQPSALLFQEFDRLLFLAKGGRTVYFGDIGKQSRVLLDYFESHGARECRDDENPAEYMLEIIGAGAAGKADKDWHEVWLGSDEASGVRDELARIQKERSDAPTSDEPHTQFAMPFAAQVWETTFRVFQQYWRMPSYIVAKYLLGIVSGLFISFSFFQPESSQQGFQNTLFSVFMVYTIFSTLVQQIQPQFVTQRSLYEVRERPSKTYSWAAFLLSNIIVEIPYNLFLGVLVWACWYFPIFGANQEGSRQGLMLLFSMQFFIFTGTFAQLVIAALPDAQTAGNISTLAFSLTLTFCGVLQAPSELPGFWIFMYRVSPLTYFVAGMAGTGLGGRDIICSSTEVSVLDPPSGQSCGQYLGGYAQLSGGRVYNPDAMTGCEYCALSSADAYLETRGVQYSERWRNFGIIWAYIGFNVFGAVALYYMFRVRGVSLRARVPVEWARRAKAWVGRKGQKVY